MACVVGQFRPLNDFFYLWNGLHRSVCGIWGLFFIFPGLAYWSDPWMDFDA